MCCPETFTCDALIPHIFASLRSSPVLPNKPVTELTEWAVEVTEDGITEPRVVLRVALGDAAGAAKTNKQTRFN